MAKSKIVEAVGTAASVGLPREHGISTRVEKAMAQAVADALAEGIPMSDTETIKARMMAARQKVLDG